MPPGSIRSRFGLACSSGGSCATAASAVRKSSKPPCSNFWLTGTLSRLTLGSGLSEAQAPRNPPPSVWRLSCGRHVQLPGPDLRRARRRGVLGLGPGSQSPAGATAGRSADLGIRTSRGSPPPCPSASCHGASLAVGDAHLFEPLGTHSLSRSAQSPSPDARRAVPLDSGSIALTPRADSPSGLFLPQENPKGIALATPAANQERTSGTSY